MGQAGMLDVAIRGQQAEPVHEAQTTMSCGTYRIDKAKLTGPILCA